MRRRKAEANPMMKKSLLVSWLVLTAGQAFAFNGQPVETWDDISVEERNCLNRLLETIGGSIRLLRIAGIGPNDWTLDRYRDQCEMEMKQQQTKGKE
jgi:hypothetical protein